MNPTITAFACSPDKGEGHARDMRVRWALEEVGQPYSVELLSMKALKEPAHRARNPFGSIPTYERGPLTLFESGAIILHIAERHEGLLPIDSDKRARVIMWLFAALNTIEPPIVEREAFVLEEKDRPWFGERLPMIEDKIRNRFADLSKRLGSDDWLEGNFSVGDLMMVMVLRRLEDGAQSLLDEFPNLSRYVARGEARAAYKRAFKAQHEVYIAATTDTDR